MNRKKPEYICHSCGISFCNGPINEYATFSLGKCECCGVQNVPCTQPRDYGYFSVWPLPDEVDPLPYPRRLSDLVEPVLEDFNFEKVHRCMKLLDWQWVDPNETLCVPTIERMRTVARTLLTTVVNSKNYNFYATGGFYAEKILDDASCDNGLILKFVLEDSESYLGDFYDR